MTSALLVLLLFVSAPTQQSGQGKASTPTGSLMWNAYLENNLRFQNKNPPGVFSSFTPENDITVKRVEVESASGPSRTRWPAYRCPVPPLELCAVRPALRLTDGVVSYTLNLSDPATLPLITDCFSQISPPGTSTDSGPLDVNFSAGKRIQLFIIPGDLAQGAHYQPGSVSECSMGEMNVVIQYRTR